MFIFLDCRLEISNFFSYRGAYLRDNMSIIKDLELLDNIVAVLDDGNIQSGINPFFIMNLV